MADNVLMNDGSPVNAGSLILHITLQLAGFRGLCSNKCWQHFF